MRHAKPTTCLVVHSSTMYTHIPVSGLTTQLYNGIGKEWDRTLGSQDSRKKQLIGYLLLKWVYRLATRILACSAHCPRIQELFLRLLEIPEHDLTMYHKFVQQNGKMTNKSFPKGGGKGYYTNTPFRQNFPYLPLNNAGAIPNITTTNHLWQIRQR